MRAGLQLPTAIVGLDVNDWSRVGRRYNEMVEVLTENGESAHAFETVLRAPPTPDELDLD
jgi:hypothetical protein